MAPVPQLDCLLHWRRPRRQRRWRWSRCLGLCGADASTSSFQETSTPAAAPFRRWRRAGHRPCPVQEMEDQHCVPRHFEGHGRGLCHPIHLAGYGSGLPCRRPPIQEMDDGRNASPRGHIRSLRCLYRPIQICPTQQVDARRACSRRLTVTASATASVPSRR